MPEKCVACHSYKSNDDKVPSEKGGHTFKLDNKVCLKCHEKPNDMVAEWKTKLAPKIKELENLLENYPDKSSRIYYSAKRNYTMVIADGGSGIHNPQYAEVLLQYSISKLTSESTWK